MFDCGEGTQVQLQRSIVKPGKINKIFITHLHGDHLFGLPGMMCLLQGSATGQPGEEPLEIFGPVGLARYIRTSLVLSGTELLRPYVVHEINIEEAEVIESEEALHHNELPVRRIDINKEGHFDLFKSALFTVKAGILQHRIPCVGFVVTESDTVGSINVELLKSYGVKPGPDYGKLKRGESIVTASGETVTSEMVLGKDKKGRKIVVLGDTCNNSKIEAISLNADCVVHEATHQDELVEKALECGHSTPSMASAFCEKIGADQLVLTHFSQRYRDTTDSCKEGEVCTSYLVEQATRPGLTTSAAHDLFNYTVKRRVL